jgi:hypothetical protein
MGTGSSKVSETGFLVDSRSTMSPMRRVGSIAARREKEVSRSAWWLQNVTGQRRRMMISKIGAGRHDGMWNVEFHLAPSLLVLASSPTSLVGASR